MLSLRCMPLDNALTVYRTELQLFPLIALCLSPWSILRHGAMAGMLEEGMLEEGIHDIKQQRSEVIKFVWLPYGLTWLFLMPMHWALQGILVRKRRKWVRSSTVLGSCTGSPGRGSVFSFWWRTDGFSWWWRWKMLCLCAYAWVWHCMKGGNTSIGLCMGIWACMTMYWSCLQWAQSMLGYLIGCSAVAVRCILWDVLWHGMQGDWR